MATGAPRPASGCSWKPRLAPRPCPFCLRAPPPSPPVSPASRPSLSALPSRTPVHAHREQACPPGDQRSPLPLWLPRGLRPAFGPRRLPPLGQHEAGTLLLVSPSPRGLGWRAARAPALPAHGRWPVHAAAPTEGWWVPFPIPRVRAPFERHGASRARRGARAAAPALSPSGWRASPLAQRWTVTGAEPSQQPRCPAQIHLDACLLFGSP